MVERMERAEHFEYGIARRGKVLNLVHRQGMTKEEADLWLMEAIADGIPPQLFQVVRRPIGKWEPDEA